MSHEFARSTAVRPPSRDMWMPLKIAVRIERLARNIGTNLADQHLMARCLDNRLLRNHYPT
jgi:hypothetical protein